MIACSSSSSITKRFASNSFDRQLADKLIKAEDQIISACSTLSIKATILRPTLIYGRVGEYTDQNLSRLLCQMRRFPILPLPAQSGLRQPIHASQLAAVTFYLAQQSNDTGYRISTSQRIALGVILLLRTKR